MKITEVKPDFRNLILEELVSCVRAVSSSDLDTAVEILLQAQRIFVTGAGRSGLAIRMAAMRLMHLGLSVHVVGEVTTPAICPGDVLLIASGSGKSAGALLSAEIASGTGAKVLLFTTASDSPLKQRATHSIVIPAASKQDHAGVLSQQYAGSLFEQSVLIIADALFQQMWQMRGESAEQLWTRHANLE